LSAASGCSISGLVQAALSLMLWVTIGALGRLIAYV
jgi:hypothetical protein